MSDNVGAVLSQHQQCSGTKDAIIIRRLVAILAFANICPVEKRQQLAEERLVTTAAYQMSNNSKTV